MLLAFQACNGIFSDIYDTPEFVSQYGFFAINEVEKTGSVYVDATDYKKWIYLNFHTKQIDSLQNFSEQSEPLQWDIALHRYDVKTNGGVALETDYSDLKQVQTLSSLPQGDWQADRDSQIMVDLSRMLEEIIEYTPSRLNAPLCKWLDVDLSTMPPIYTPSNKVYLVQLQDKTVLALKFSDFINQHGAKGFITIDYIYPLNL